MDQVKGAAEALLRLLRAQEEIAYSLLLERSFPAEAATFAMSVALLRKGRSLDEAAGASRAAYQSLDDSSRKQLDELRDTRAKLVELTMAGSSDTAELQHLADHADEVEQALAKQSAPLRARRLLARPSEIVTRVAQALPPDGVFVEVVAFRPSAVRAPRQDAGSGPQCYLALILHRDASVRVVPLGPAAPIDQLVSDFRAQLTVDPKDGDDTHQVLTASEALYHRVFEPLRAQFGKADKNIFLSLDSQLHLVPFAALFEGNQYLVETYQFTYLTSGRDLLRGEVGPRNSTTVAMIANPEFIKGRARGPALRSECDRRGLSMVPDRSQSGTHDAAPYRSFRLTSLCPLPGTVEETQDLRQLLPAVRVLLGTNATRQAFLGLRSPGILHVATHGLFRRGTDDAAPGSRTEIESDRAALLNSMLMLAGAGVKSNGEVVVQPDGVVTALDVAGMNLWGTQLVVLSACETGVGDVSNLGQGVYGLRRAVMIAGAETLVTSLWKVDDRATRELMRRYYESLLAGHGRVEAMRETADWMRRRRKHPYYWASFIVVGSRNPLVGIGIDRKQ
ncbi:MAG TPA: CHAT domain-containing protein [Kofleriaceae bacterium]